MANRQYESNYGSFSPTDVHEVDMDRRADWAETDADDPSYIANKPTNIDKLPAVPAKAAADKTYILKVSSTGVVSWVESAVYSAQ